MNVAKDNGYIATDSLAGGRQASPLRVTPAPVSSITSQFISDLKMTNIQDALKWSLNAVPTSDRNGFNGGSGGGVFNFWSVSIRGDQHVQGGNPPTKNYYPLFVISDTYNVERIEFDQGPNSILFGIGDLGGATTSYTKRPRFDKSFDTVDLSYNNYGGYRGTIDTNLIAGDFALRVNAVAADEKGWRDGDFHKKLGVTVAGEFKFNQDRSHLRLEVEGWKEKKAIYGASYLDGASLWDGTTGAATWGQAIDHLGDNPQNTPGAPGVTGMSDWGLNPYNVIVAGGNGKVMNWAGGVRSMGLANVGTPIIMRPSAFSYAGATVLALPSKEFAVAPRDGYVKPEDINLTLTYDQVINENMDFEISGYRYVDDAYAINYEGGNSNPSAYDLNKQLPDGTPNPNYGVLYSDFFLDKQVQNHWVNEVRGQFSYHFDTTVFGVPLKQMLSLSAGEQVTEYDARQYNAQDISGDPAFWNDANWTSKLVWGRVYWNNPQAGFNVPSTVRYTPLPFNWYDFDSKQTIKYGGLYSQSRLWDDRLNITLGARRDDFENHKIGLRGTGNTDVVGQGAGNTYSAGVVGYVLPWLGVVGNYSENYQPAAGGLAPTVYGEVLGAAKGKGKNVGLRVSTLDGKYYASVNYYKTTGDNVIGGDAPDFQGIWQDYLKAGGTKTDIGPAGNITGSPGSYQAAMNSVDTYSILEKGWELEVVANPTKNIRLIAHYAAPEGEKTNNGPNGVRYFAEHLSDWQAVASGNSTDAQKLAADLATAQQNFTIWANPTLAAGVVDNMWNAFATYTFTDDTLAGFDVGFGIQHTGARQVDQTSRTTSFNTETLVLGYSTRLNLFNRQLHTRFQLNVDNVFGNDTLVFQTGASGYPAYDYNFIPPRKITLSATLEF
ncbi:MAG TPA: TonB-dependent receptor plug domain-containing protein [Opitutus sp.]|nr:TonB-dependent receptor plug domain-containing protein [Opitutus sp.]